MLIWMTSALYVYEFFKMFHTVCLFRTVPQFGTLEYVSISKTIKKLLLNNWILYVGRRYYKGKKP